MQRSLKRTNVVDLAVSRHNSEVWEVIRTLVNGGADSSRLLELYYWSQEPGIVELVRALLELDERARQTISSFMLAGQTQSIAAAIDSSNSLVLTRSEPAQVRPAKQRQ